jgi:hypothetical protein
LSIHVTIARFNSVDNHPGAARHTDRIGSNSDTATIEAGIHGDDEMEDVSKWSRRQWNEAKAKWSQEKAKWSDCQKRADQKKLSGRKSWTFLYNCMTE